MVLETQIKRSVHDSAGKMFVGLRMGKMGQKTRFFEVIGKFSHFFGIFSKMKVDTIFCSCTNFKFEKNLVHWTPKLGVSQE